MAAYGTYNLKDGVAVQIESYSAGMRLKLSRPRVISYFHLAGEDNNIQDLRTFITPTPDPVPLEELLNVLKSGTPLQNSEGDAIVKQDGKIRWFSNEPNGPPYGGIVQADDLLRHQWFHVTSAAEQE